MVEGATRIEPQMLTQQLAKLLCAWGAGPESELADWIESALQPLAPERLREIAERFATTGASWGYHPPDPFVRSLSRAIMGRVLAPGSALEGGAGLVSAAREGPVLLVGNHLSYVDVNVFDHLLAREGLVEIADRITALVGPKVFTAPVRRLASLCFGTIKIPQSSAVASEQEPLAPREIARLATAALDVVRERSGQGDVVLLFPEGLRSRTGSLRPLLPAASRYFERMSGTGSVVPFAHWGTEKLVPLGEDHVYATCVHARVGVPLPLAELRERCQRRRSLLSDTVGFAIADLLPPAYRGTYGAVEPGQEQARKIASDLGAR